MEEHHAVPQQKGPQYNPSSAQGFEADTAYQYGKGDHGAKAENPTMKQSWDEEAPGGND